MSTVGATGDDRDHLGDTLQSAEFVRLLGTRDGDALAATGLLARACSAIETPFQASLAAVPDVDSSEGDGASVSVGCAGGDVELRSPPLSAVALEAVDGFTEPDTDAVELAAAGVLATGAEPSGRLLERLDAERRPGVGIPTDDPTDLARSTLLHTEFSGDTAAVPDLDGRELASAVALSIGDAPPSAADAVADVLRPYEGQRFATLDGYADVLDALATDRPGTGLAFAFGNDVEAPGLRMWRERGSAIHDAIRRSETSRYDGLFVARIGAELDDSASSEPTDDSSAPARFGTLARLVLSYRSPEPVCLAVGDGAVAVAATEGTDVETPFRRAVGALDGRATARSHRGVGVFEGGSGDAIEAFRTELEARR